jgi:hypothetical protein
VELLVIAATIRPPLTHTAAYERNISSGRSPTNQPLPPEYTAVSTSLPCKYWEPQRATDRAAAGLREGPNVVLVALGPRMLVSAEADVKIGDVVTEVRSGAGVITAQRQRVVEILWRASHQEVGLELVASGPVQEGS